MLGEGCIGLVKKVISQLSNEEYAVKKVVTDDEEIIFNVFLIF